MLSKTLSISQPKLQLNALPKLPSVFRDFGRGVVESSQMLGSIRDLSEKLQFAREYLRGLEKISQEIHEYITNLKHWIDVTQETVNQL